MRAPDTEGPGEQPKSAKTIERDSPTQFLKDWAKITAGFAAFTGVIVGASLLAMAGPWGAFTVGLACFLGITALVAAVG